MNNKKPPLNQVILSRVKQECDKKNITIRKAQRNCGLTKTTIYRWDRSMPLVDSLYKVACYFNVSLDYLTGRTDEPQTTRWKDLPDNLQTVDIEVLKLVNDIVKKGVPIEDIKEVLEITKNINNIE